jgi:hypothetical protein
VTAAINRRNEQLMAARLAHEGGTLAIIPKPERVDRYEKGGARTGEKQSRQLFQSSMARHARLRKEGHAVGEVGAKAGDSGAGKRGSLPVKRKRGLGEGVRKIGDEWFDDADAELEKLRYDSEDEDEQLSDDEGQQPQEERNKDDEAKEEKKKENDKQSEERKDVADSSAAAADADAAKSSRCETSAASTQSGSPSLSSAYIADQKQKERPTKQQRTKQPNSTGSRPSQTHVLIDKASHTVT